MPKKHVRRRVVRFNLLFLLIISLLSLRLAYIQVAGHEELSTAAVKQQRVKIEGADARGIIYDRNMVPLTGIKQDYVYIISKKTIEEKGGEPLAKYNARRISSYNRDYAVYTFSDFNRKADTLLRADYGAYVMKAERRYKNNQTAAHILGYVKELEGSGASGVELAFNDILAERKRAIFATADVTGKIISGIGLFSNVENGNSGIVTTLDSKLQEEVEKILNACKKNAAVIILQSGTGQILAAASTPTFNPNMVKEYLGSENAELVNKVIQGEYPPGSIFKILVAAAALENQVKDAAGNPVGLKSTFYCAGTHEINGIKIKCSTGGQSGHGEITLEDAFAKSCNSAFIQLGELTGGKGILEIAAKFGFGRIALGDIANEKTGNLTKEGETAGAGIGNLSIGQGSLLTTPVQIVKMTNVIANDGIDVGVSLLLDTKKTPKRIISCETARLIKKMMAHTMKYGTGSNLKSEEAVAGKTGSAEAWADGREVIHGWFTGFSPAENPGYTVTVFVDDGRSGRTSAVPIFESIEKYIENRKNKSETPRWPGVLAT